MAGFEEKKDKVAELGIKVFAASVDPDDKAQEVQESVPSVTVLNGVTEEIAETLGSWWEGNRNFIQPSEFIINREGRILNSTYSSGPVGRLTADDALRIIGFMKSRG